MNPMASIVNSLRILSDPTRMRLMLLLVDEELTVAELQEIVGLGQSRISSGLGQLKRGGLAADRRVGKNMFYRAKAEATAPLAEVLAAARQELAECTQDREALKLALRKRKDRAAEYFNKLAGRFGRVYVPGRSWEALSHALLRLLPPMVIADMGAGEGTLAQLLARTARKVIAIDNSERMVEFGAALAKEHGFENLDYRLGDIEDPPISAGTVDLALFSQALHHVSSPQRALTAAYRILRPGGRIVILDLAAHSYEAARELYAHVWLGFTEIQIHQMLDRAGFSAIQISAISREAEPPYFQTLLAAATR